MRSTLCCTRLARTIAFNCSPSTSIRFALTKGFVAARIGGGIDDAMAQLRRRVPLGATDMGIALTKAANSFGEKSAAQRSVIYLGDGSSAANRTMNEYSDVVGSAGRPAIFP